MDIIKPRTLSGFMELLPEKQLCMDAMKTSLARVYESFGYIPLDTPAIEAAEILLAKGGGETEKQIYRFAKGDSDLALRFDLTVPLAKYVAMHAGQLSFPFRRYQIGKVWRGERAQKGRFREFYQADIDVIGDGRLDLANDAEVCAVIAAAMPSLGLDRFCIRLNNRKLLNGLFEVLGLQDRASEVMQTVDKLEKIGPDKVAWILTTDYAVPAETADTLLAVLQSGDAESMRGRSALLDEGLSELDTVTGLLPSLGLAPENYRRDLTIARGLDYYTGTVYETQALDMPSVGSVCSGGRYENLAGFYTDRALPGVGVSIGLTRLFYVLDESGRLNADGTRRSPADVLVLPMGDTLAACAAAAATLRAAGLRVQLYGEDKKFKAKMGYADKLGIPWAVIIGEDEKTAGTVSLKNLRTGEQVSLRAEAAAEWIAAEEKKK